MSAFQEAGVIMGRMRRMREDPVMDWETARFACLDMVKEAMAIHDDIPDTMGSNEICREMLRNEIGKLQKHFGWME